MGARAAHLGHQDHLVLLALAVLDEALAPVQVPNHRALELCGGSHLRAATCLDASKSARQVRRLRYERAARQSEGSSRMTRQLLQLLLSFGTPLMCVYKLEADAP